MGLFLNVFTQICLPIFIMIGVGWCMDRKFRLDLGGLVKLNIYLFVPSFIFVHVVSSELDTAVAGRVVLFTLAMVVGLFLLSEAVSRWRGETIAEKRALQLATMFYNSGNYGLPLMILAYPVVGPLLQVFVLLTQNVTTFSVGLLLAASGHGGGWRGLLPVLRQVTLWAVAAAFVVRGFNLPVQEVVWIWTPLTYFANALIGVALITLGVQLSKTHPKQNWNRLPWALGLRLLAGPALAFLLVPLFGFEGTEAAVLILGAGVPTAVNTALIAHEFKADSQFAAAAVFYSTLGSMVTITVLIVLLRTIWA